MSSMIVFDLMRQFHGIWQLTWKTYRMSSLFIPFNSHSFQHSIEKNSMANCLKCHHTPGHTIWQQAATTTKTATSNEKEPLTKMYSINKWQMANVYGQSFRARIYWFCSNTFDVFCHFPVCICSPLFFTLSDSFFISSFIFIIKRTQHPHLRECCHT